jgi:hypothetical protein
MYRIFHVMNNERALLFYRGRFAGVLRAGQYRFFDLLGRYSIEYFPAQGPQFRQRLAQLQSTNSNLVWLPLRWGQLINNWRGLLPRQPRIKLNRP